MTNKQAYKQILLEKECLKNRATCDKDCTNCMLNLNTSTLNDSLDFVLNILKSRDPVLYLYNDIEMLKETINNEDQNQEASQKC